jgi:hypothetical protein
MILHFFVERAMVSIAMLVGPGGAVPRAGTQPRAAALAPLQARNASRRRAILGKFFGTRSRE